VALREIAEATGANLTTREGVTMTTNKLNKARVADLHTTMTGYVERGDIPGIVTLIGRGGEIRYFRRERSNRHGLRQGE